jgi:membrane associated rhomboid family serine protease
LWLFGTPVELVLGHGRFLALYLLAGVLASLVYVTAVTAFNLNRYAPIIGASGAVSALLAAYLLLWRLGKLPNLPTSTKLLASVGLAVWLLWHLLGFFPTGSMAAHLGGFAAGFLLTWPLAGVSKR